MVQRRRQISGESRIVKMAAWPKPNNSPYKWLAGTDTYLAIFSKINSELQSSFFLRRSWNIIRPSLHFTKPNNPLIIKQAPYPNIKKQGRK